MWFMRQAGRSLPEYRAIRERHSFWEVAGSPELCAEVTLAAGAAPRRRRGGDVRRHHDPGARDGAATSTSSRVSARSSSGRCGRWPTSSASPPRSRRGVRTRCSRRSASCVASSNAEQAVVGFCGGPFTVAGYLVEGRPSREFALVKALMYSEPGGLARADGEARGLFRVVRRGAGAGGRRRRAALRLVGRRALACRLRGVRRTVVGAHPGRLRAPPRRSISGPAPRRCCRRWRAPAAT